MNRLSIGKCLLIKIALMSAILLLAAGCAVQNEIEEINSSGPIKKDTEIPSVITLTKKPEIEPIPQVTSTAVFLATSIPLIEVNENSFLNPAGCKRPSDDYSIVEGEYWALNQRTYEMLKYADSLYGGEIDLSGFAITQGSFSNAEPHSFGTHSGGGAVDISVMREGTYKVLYSEIYEIVRALRTAGFAAWFRDFDEVYPGSPVHIHVVAIGDEQLSDAALGQLIGDAGYFKKYSGLLDDYGNPEMDRFGGPIICDWMLELYGSETQISGPAVLLADIQFAAQNYIPGSKTSFLFAQYSNKNSDNSWYSIVNAEVLHDILLETGKLPDALLADFNGKSFLESFQIFSESRQTWYEAIKISEPFMDSRERLIGIKPGDILFLNGDDQSAACGFENIFLVTRMDDNGFPWSVGVQKKDGEMIISEIELFSDEGCFISGISGVTGFIWYKKISAENEDRFYSVEPGDTLMTISRKFNVDIQELILTNRLTIKDLKTGQELLIP